MERWNLMEEWFCKKDNPPGFKKEDEMCYD